jgi:hypothetical protein
MAVTKYCLERLSSSLIGWCDESKPVPLPENEGKKITVSDVPVPVEPKHGNAYAALYREEWRFGS